MRYRLERHPSDPRMWVVRDTQGRNSYTYAKDQRKIAEQKVKELNKG